METDLSLGDVRQPHRPGCVLGDAHHPVVYGIRDPQHGRDRRVSRSQRHKLHLQTLLERRRILAKYWLSKADALSEFSIRRAMNWLVLSFRDLMVDCKLASADSTRYVYEIKSPHFKSAKKTTGEPQILFDRAELGAAMETLNGAPIQISIWTNRPGTTSPPVTIEFDWNPTRGAPLIKRISSG